MDFCEAMLLNHTISSGVTEGVQVVRAHRPEKILPKLKLCFLIKVTYIYIKNLKESSHAISFSKKP